MNCSSLLLFVVPIDCSVLAIGAICDSATLENYVLHCSWRCYWFLLIPLVFGGTVAGTYSCAFCSLLFCSTTLLIAIVYFATFISEDDITVVTWSYCSLLFCDSDCITDFGWSACCWFILFLTFWLRFRSDAVLPVFVLMIDWCMILILEFVTPTADYNVPWFGCAVIPARCWYPCRFVTYITLRCYILMPGATCCWITVPVVRCYIRSMQAFTDWCDTFMYWVLIAVWCGACYARCRVLTGDSSVSLYIPALLFVIAMRCVCSPLMLFLQGRGGAVIAGLLPTLPLILLEFLRLLLFYCRWYSVLANYSPLRWLFIFPDDDRCGLQITIPAILLPPILPFPFLMIVVSPRCYAVITMRIRGTHCVTDWLRYAVTVVDCVVLITVGCGRCRCLLLIPYCSGYYRALSISVWWCPLPGGDAAIPLPRWLLLRSCWWFHDWWFGDVILPFVLPIIVRYATRYLVILLTLAIRALIYCWVEFTFVDFRYDVDPVFVYRLAIRTTTAVLFGYRYRSGIPLYITFPVWSLFYDCWRYRPTLPYVFGLLSLIGITVVVRYICLIPIPS